VKSDANSLSSYSQESFRPGIAPKWRRFYLEWSGQNTILCQGRVIGGPEISKLSGTVTLLIVPSVLFIVYVAKVFESKYNEKNVMIFGVILPILCILTLFKTAFTEPGIIPRKEIVQSNRD